MLIEGMLIEGFDCRRRVHLRLGLCHVAVRIDVDEKMAILAKKMDGGIERLVAS